MSIYNYLKSNYKYYNKRFGYFESYDIIESLFKYNFIIKKRGNDSITNMVGSPGPWHTRLT
jgi:hypothetical protein